MAWTPRGGYDVEAVALKQLETRLHEPLTVQERVRLLNEMSEQLCERDPTRGAQLAREAIELARATGDVPGEAQGLYCLGRNLYCQADYPLVFETQAAANALFRTLGDTHGEARCANLLGITHRQLSDYSRALEMYEAALKLDAGNPDAHFNAARLHERAGRYEAALRHLREYRKLTKD
jgi:tetratricopeptide (TPR) repeat protein